MCGLIGAFRADDAVLPKIEHFMWQGLYMSALRGMGGTGVGIVHRDYEMDFAKSHVSAPNFLCSEEWEWIDKNLVGARAVLGHTRSATTGSVKTKNSHPFAFQDGERGTLMIHNGHIKNWATLSPATYSHEVDSAHVAYSLHHKGALETLKELDGAYTLIWYDKKNRTLNLARNEERELFYAMNEAKTTFWFASELDMLSSVLRRNGIPHVGGKNFFELPKFTLCSYDLTKKVLEPTLTGYEEKKYLPAYPNGNGGRFANQNDSYRNYTKTIVENGDHIWVNVKDEDNVALSLYKQIGDGEDQVSPSNAYGYIYGTRSMDYGSLVKVVGISYHDWFDRLRFIKTCLPAKIIRIENNKKRENGTGVYNFYECTLDHAGVGDEIKRLGVSIALRKEKEREKADAGRSLPPPKPVEQPIVGQEGGVVPPEGGGASVGPNDGGHAGGRVRDMGGVRSTPEKVPGPKGTKISYDQWEQMASEGCWICDGIILDMDIGNVEFWEHPRNVEDRNVEDSEYAMICPLCKANPKRVEALVL